MQGVKFHFEMLKRPLKQFVLNFFLCFQYDRFIHFDQWSSSNIDNPLRTYIFFFDISKTVKDIYDHGMLSTYSVQANQINDKWMSNSLVLRENGLGVYSLILEF